MLRGLVREHEGWLGGQTGDIVECLQLRRQRAAIHGIVWQPAVRLTQQYQCQRQQQTRDSKRGDGSVSQHAGMLSCRWLARGRKGASPQFSRGA